HRLALTGGDEGTLAGREVHRVADRERLRPLDEPLDDRVVLRLGDEEPRPRLARLSLVEEAAEERAVDRHLEVGVVEDDVGRLAAQLEGHLLDGAGSELLNAPADLRRAGERDLVDERARAQLLAALGAAPVDDVDDALREIGLVDDLRELERRA